MNVEKLLILAGIPVTPQNVETTRQVLAELNDRMEAEKNERNRV